MCTTVKVGKSGYCIIYNFMGIETERLMYPYDDLPKLCLMVVLLLALAVNHLQP